MAGDVKKRLEVEATYRDLVTPGAAKSAKAVEDVGKRSAKAADQAAGRWDKFNSKFLSLGDVGAKVAGVTGSAFASMGASVSLATANMDSLGSSIAGAAGSVAAGFGAGGPVGGALALASAGVGALIFMFKQAKEESREAAKVAAESYREAASGIRDFAQAARELRQEQEFRLRIAQRIAQGEEVDLERLNLRRERVRRVNEAIRQHNEVVEKARELQQAVSDLDSDDDDERAVAAREALADATDDLAASEQRLADLRSSFDTAEQTLAIERRTKAREEEQKRIAEELERGREAARQRIEARQALEDEIAARERVVWWGSEGARQAEEDLRIGRLRAEGYVEQAERLRQVVEAERAHARALKQKAEDEKRAAEARRIAQTMQGLDFRRRRAQTGEDPMQNLLLRHAEELARFEGTRAEKAALVRAQYAEQQQLAERIADAANREVEAKRKAAEQYTKGLQEAVRMLKAERDGTLELYEIRKRLAEAAKEGGRAAVAAAKEQIELERQISAEKKKQAEEKQREANFQSNLERLISGGTMDKGLARRRNERRARNRLRKYRRAGQLDAEGNYRQRGIRGEDGRRLGLIHAGGDADGLGAFSEWTDGGQDAEAKRIEDAARKRRAERTGGGDGVTQGQIDDAAAEAIRGIATTTGDGNTTRERVLEAAKAATKATEDAAALEKQTAEAMEEANAKEAEAATQRERVHASAEQSATNADRAVAALTRQGDALDSLVGALGKITDAVERNTRNVQRLLDAARLAPS